MNNRRNHYRVLCVQPDASPEVIRANYRTLLRKLKQHPDLGGEHWNAVALNAAYATLENPSKRAAYDVELLKQYGLAKLSRGPLRVKGRGRTFYQLLQVQTDAPLAIIEASFRTLLAKGAESAVALTEAFVTLRDPARRERYDRQLEAGARPESVPATPPERVPPASQAVARYQLAAPPPTGYEPLITRYCLFCKTPHDAVPSTLREGGCSECGSPLFAPPADFLDQARRALGRIAKDESVGFYTFWPGARREARMLDLSPTGMRMLTRERCEIGDIVKIDAQRLQAVAEIVHQHRDHAGTTAGVKFHTVGFHESLGSFLDARA